MLRTPIENVMRSPPVTALASDTVSSISKKMVSNNIGAIILMMEGLKVGIVTERDLVEKVIMVGMDPKVTQVKDIMSSPIVAIEVHEPVSTALRLMRNKRIRRLAVTKDGRLVGIVTERRLLDSLATLV